MAGAVSFGDIQRVLDDAIRNVAVRWRLRGADAEDFAQEVRLAVLRRDRTAVRQFRGDGAFTYFCRIATRVAIERMRHQAGRPRGGDEVWSRRLRPLNPSESRIEPDLDAAAQQEHVVQALRRVLAEFEDDELVFLARRFVRGESAETIAHVVGGSRTSTARRLASLLGEIRDMLIQVHVTGGDVRAVMASCRIDAGLLDRSDPIRSVRRLCVSRANGRTSDLSRQLERADPDLPMLVALRSRR